jgi:hypothetical protein
VSKFVSFFFSRTRVLAASFLLLLVACTDFQDKVDSSLNASLEPNPVLSGTIQKWQTGKTGVLKFRLVKNNTVGSALFDNSNTIGEFPVDQNGTFNAPLPTPTELETLLEPAKTIMGKIPYCGSSTSLVPDTTKMAMVYLDLFWDAITPTYTQLLAANTDALQHFDLAAVPVSSKFAAYIYVDSNTIVKTGCGLLVAGSLKANLNLKKGWNLVWLEVTFKGFLNYTDYRISTDGIPDGLQWYTFGQNTNIPIPPPPENPTPLPPDPIVPRAIR